MRIQVINRYCMAVLLVMPSLSIADSPSYRCTPGQSETGTTANSFDKPAQALASIEPAYPELLRRLHSNGEVLLRFTVTKDGTVKDINVIASQHPALEASAVTAILNTKYKPSELSGRPVDSCVEQTVKYEMQTTGHIAPITIPQPYNVSGFDLFDLLSGKKQDYDAPPKVKLAVAAVYPYEMMRQNQEGKAKVSLTIDPNGNVAQATVIEASHPDFGFAAQAMIETWKFEPAQKAGKNVLSVLTKEQTFSLTSANADNADYSESNTELMKALTIHQPRIYAQDELDSIPAIRYQVLPVYPRSLLSSGLNGETKLEFFVDQTGMVQWPRTLTASRPEFGWAAVTAVKRWIFEIPKKDGKAVNGRFVIPFDFKAPPRL